MAYNHGREDRKWRIWKEAEEKLLRECGVDEATIEQIRIADRADFNSNRRFYRWTNDVEHGPDCHYPPPPPLDAACVENLPTSFVCHDTSK